MSTSPYFFYWLPLREAANVILWDELPTSSLSFIPEQGKIAETVVLQSQFSSSQPTNAMAVLVFNKEHLPPGGLDYNGKSIREITEKVLSAYVARDQSLLNKLVIAGKKHTSRFLNVQDERYYTNPLQPFAHGLVAVGTLGSKQTKSVKTLRNLADMKGLLLAHGETSFELAANLGKAWSEKITRKAPKSVSVEQAEKMVARIEQRTARSLELLEKTQKKSQVQKIFRKEMVVSQLSGTKAKRSSKKTTISYQEDRSLLRGGDVYDAMVRNQLGGDLFLEHGHTFLNINPAVHLGKAIAPDGAITLALGENLGEIAGFREGFARVSGLGIKTEDQPHREESVQPKF